jgi:hypothetical protein
MSGRRDERPAVVLMHRRLGTSVGEQIVEAARRAAALDVLDTLAATGRFGRRLVVTNDPALVAALAGADVTIEPSGPDFHFGRRLTALVARPGAGPLRRAAARLTDRTSGRR